MKIISKNYNLQVEYMPGTQQGETCHKLFKDNLDAYDAKRNWNVSNTDINWKSNSYLDRDLNQILKNGDFSILNV